MIEQDYYLGLDIGTDSVGYATTNTTYDLLKFHGEPAWGVQIFDQGSLAGERRGFRTSRRRLDRRQQRVQLVQEIFAPEIVKVDPKFYVRIMNSAKYSELPEEERGLFCSPDMTDRMYHKEFPTIHHLIVELMTSSEPHDVRLVYLACAWLVAHRGHFLSNIDIANLSSIKDFNVCYSNFYQFFIGNGYEACWENADSEKIGEILLKKAGVSVKKKELAALLFPGSKPTKGTTSDFPFSREGIVSLLAGGTVKMKDFFGKEEYDEYGSLSLGMDDEKLAEIAANIGDDYEVIELMRSIHDWSVLVDILGETKSISESKVRVYDQHKEDLKTLKYFIRKYVPKDYAKMFRSHEKNNYVSWVYHTDDGDTSDLTKAGKEDFSKAVLSVVKGITPETADEERFQDMKMRLELRTFLPKQKDTDNRVIPNQLYQYEMMRILEQASGYLPFLLEADSEGYVVKDKLISIFSFRIPYYVGPLNEHSQHAWLVRKAGKIYPWNFNEMVDLDASEQNFIQRMTNTCTYLPGEPVLPKDSLAYHKFTVLNEINNIRIYGQRVSVELKQAIYNEVFLNKKKVTPKYLFSYLVQNGYLKKGEEEYLTGIDTNINSNLSSQIAFMRLISEGTLSENDVEKIIERSSYAEDKQRLAKWLRDHYGFLPAEDQKYICGLKLKDFGRLSMKFLNGLEGVNKETGEVTTILGALWNTQCNLMELLSDKFTFSDEIEAYSKEYYSDGGHTLADRLDEMYISNAVRRPIYRTLDIVKDVEKAFGAPKKIFIEMTRGATDEQRGKRTKSRKQQILDLYSMCKDEEVKVLKKQLEAMGDYADNRLQGDKLFLYFIQLGKSMYSGTPIELEKLGTKEYDIDHIYPQAYVKDDSIINNKVLVLSKENGEKSDVYPIQADIRMKMTGYWKYLKEVGLLSDEKYARLVRATPFTADEKMGFINRQLTETSQATKAVATLLQERYPDTEIVYCKARLTSEFRQEFDLLKSRSFNDLHHAVDAYLNIVTGNVYNMKFTKKWFHVDANYSIKTKTIFTHSLVCDGVTVWDGEPMLAKVKKTAVKNNAHFNKYSYFKRGGLFDQMPVSKAEGLVPLKKGLPTETYGGYNRAGAMFYIPVCYMSGKKSDTIIMSVELLRGKQFLSDEKFAEEYCFSRLKYILGKKVDSVSFPMGMRPWKVNTMLSLDGFRVCIAGISNRGKCLVAQPVMQFSESAYWRTYLKKVERFCEKLNSNTNYLYDVEYDKVNAEDNCKFYDIYLAKLENSIYSKRVNCPANTLRNGREMFVNLSIANQCRTILNIQQVFGRLSGGVDLSMVGGVSHAAATVSFSANVSNWRKSYTDVRIVDSSSSGLWEKVSGNILDVL